MYSCTFIGHKDCSQEIMQSVSMTIESLIIREKVRVFYVGTHGNFDRLVYNVLDKLAKIYDIRIIVVLSYLKNSNVYYDMSKTEFPVELEKVPPKYAIKKRNEYMLKRSKYLVCYINNAYSNSYKFITIAQRMNIQIINLGELQI